MILLRVPVEGLPAAVVNGSVEVDGSTYGLSPSADRASYAATFIPGLRFGSVPIAMTLVLADGQRFSVRLESTLLSYGKVREASVFGKGEGISGAWAAVYLADGKKQSLWDPSGTQQQNPMLTAADGSYGFIVPNGRYVLRIGKEGYRSVERTITVTNNAINNVVELTRAPRAILEVINAQRPILENVAAVAEQIQLRVQSPENQEVTKDVVAPTIATVAVVNVATAVSAFNLFNYLRFFLTQPLLLLGRKKRRKWGVVYNALSKRPVDLAIVRLMHAQTNLVLQTRITDAVGRYAFIVNAGSYRLQAVKPKFVFPTAVMKGEKEDVDFLDLYHGETITVKESSTLTPNIPLDPMVKEETPKMILFKQTMRKIQHGASITSVVIAAGAVFVVPTLLMAGFAVVQLIMYLLFRRLALPPKPAGWGIVYEQGTKKRLSRTVVRIFNKKYNKLLETQLTDEKGRYGFVVGRDIYYLMADHPHYDRYISPEIDLTGAKDTLIDKEISLLKKNLSTGKQ